MKKLVFIVFFYLFGLLGCKSTDKPQLSGIVLEITPSELSKYWVPKPLKLKKLPRRPDEFPRGAGTATYFVTIDSNGNELDRILISSTPDKWMTQRLLDKMPKIKYKPAGSNIERIPVKLESTFETSLRR